MQLNFKEILAKMLDWIHFPFLHNSVANTNTFYRARRDDTEVEVALGVGSGGLNHGVWSDKQSRWLLYGNNSDIYIGNKNITNRWVATNSAAKSVTATSQTINFCSITLPANGQYLLLSNVITGKGNSLTLLNNIVVTSGSPTTQFGTNTRVTTTSGQGVVNWKYIKTGDAAVTVTLQGYSYSDGGTGYTQTGYLFAVML